MSEKQPKNTRETLQNNEQDRAAAELSRQNIERIKQLAEQEKQPNENKVESLREQVESLAKKTEEQPVESQENKRQPDFDQTQLKKQSFDKSLKKVQSQLSPSERVLSKFMHNKKVESLSEFGSKTIARPSGIVGGGLLALVGSSVILYFAKHYGYTYNFGIILLLYVAGFTAGILFELALSKRRSKQ